MVNVGIFIAVVGGIVGMSGYNVSVFGLPKLWLLTVANLFIWGGIALDSRRMKFNPMLVPALMFIVVAVVCSLDSLDYTLSVFGHYRTHAHSIITYSGLIALAFGVSYSREDISDLQITKTLLWCMVIAGFWAVAETAGFDPFDAGLPFGNKSSATIGHPVYYGMAIALLMPVAIREALVPDDEGRSWVGAAAIAAMVCGAYLSHKRGVWLGMGVSVTAYLAMASIMVLRRRTWALLAACAIAGAVWYSPTLLGNKSDASRIEAWKVAAHTAKMNPLTGTGPGTFVLSYRKGKTESAVASSQSSRFAHFDAHNDFLHIASEMGILGATAYVLLLVGFVACAMSAGRGSAHLIAGLLGVFVLAKIQPLSMAVEMASAVVLGLLMRASSFRAQDVRFPRVLTYVALAVGVVSCLFVTRLAVSDVYRRVAHDRRTDPLHTAQAANRAAQWAPWSMQARSDQVQSLYVIPERMNRHDTAVLMTEAVKVCRKALWWHPNSPDAWSLAGSTIMVYGYWLRKNTDAVALEAYNKAQELAPQFVPLMFQRAGLAKKLSDNPEFLRATAKARVLLDLTKGRI